MFLFVHRHGECGLYFHRTGVTFYDDRLFVFHRRELESGLSRYLPQILAGAYDDVLALGVGEVHRLSQRETVGAAFALSAKEGALWAWRTQLVSNWTWRFVFSCSFRPSFLIASRRGSSLFSRLPACRVPLRICLGVE
jgi:hypothetical protein